MGMNINLDESAEKNSIFLLDAGEITRFASNELKKYLEKFCKSVISIKEKDRYNPDEKGIWMGAADSFPFIPAPTVKDTTLDDFIYIDIEDGKGFICGGNGRSILLSVYRYLAEIGLRWVRPGKDGEYIPEKPCLGKSVKISETPSYRHRAICIEGAVSYENVRDMIDWAPKAGFNGYFLQFRESYTFFDRWYSHKKNPLKEPEKFTVERAREYCALAVSEIKKRGLVYHAVGHGWTCEPFGIPGLSWEPQEYDVPPETSRYFALADGERKICGGMPLNTNLCYSNPEVRKIVLENIIDYIEKHPEIDLLHFWLADGDNHQCECDNCKKANPSDFYVQMLNELDGLLEKHGLNTKIVFLVYADLLWAPLYESLKKQGRFILMFAPITRSYSREFAPNAQIPAPSVYVRNKLIMPGSVEENLAYLKSWQQWFKGDSFIFDYHYWCDHYRDPGYYKSAEILYRDIINLEKLGLDGYVSCQVQRVFFPTGLPMYVMGRALWNRGPDFDMLAGNYFISAFGADGDKCREYLKKLSEYFDPQYLRREKPYLDPEAGKKFTLIPKIIEEFLPLIVKNMKLENPCHAQSWSYLKHHAEIFSLYSEILAACSQGNAGETQERLEKLKTVVWEKEDMLQPVFDTCFFIDSVEGLVNSIAKQAKDVKEGGN